MNSINSLNGLGEIKVSDTDTVLPTVCLLVLSSLELRWWKRAREEQEEETERWKRQQTQEQQDERRKHQ